MADYISASWIVRLVNWLFSPFFEFYFNRPKLYLYLDKLILKTIYPKIPRAIDELTWTGELVIKNNSKFDAYDLKIEYLKEPVFTTIDKLQPHNNLPAKSEMRLKFTWLREYVKEPTGLQFRQSQIDTKFPLDKKEFVLILEYSNERGKSFYSVFKNTGKHAQTDLFLLKPRIK